MSVYNKPFWRAAGERALFTFAQALLGTPAGIALVGVLNAAANGKVDLALLQHAGLLALTSLVIAVIAAGGSILTSLVKARNDGNPSAGNQEVLNTGAALVR